MELLINYLVLSRMSNNNLKRILALSAKEAANREAAEIKNAIKAVKAKQNANNAAIAAALERSSNPTSNAELNAMLARSAALASGRSSTNPFNSSFVDPSKSSRFNKEFSSPGVPGFGFSLPSISSSNPYPTPGSKIDTSIRLSALPDKRSINEIFRNQIQVIQDLRPAKLIHWSQFDNLVTSFFSKQKDSLLPIENILANSKYTLPDFSPDEENVRKDFMDIAGAVGVSTVADGTCLLHSLFLSLSPVYRCLRDSRLKIQVVSNFRRTAFYDLFKKKSNEKFNDYKEYRNVVSSGNYSAYLEQPHLTTFANTYRVNVIVMSTNPQGGVPGEPLRHYGAIYSDDSYTDDTKPRGDNLIQSNFSKFNKNGYPYIFLVNHGEGHFSSVFLHNFKRFMITHEELVTYMPNLAKSLDIVDNKEKEERARARGNVLGKLTDADITRELTQRSSRLYPNFAGGRKTRKVRKANKRKSLRHRS